MTSLSTAIIVIQVWRPIDPAYAPRFPSGDARASEQALARGCAAGA